MVKDAPCKRIIILTTECLTGMTLPVCCGHKIGVGGGGSQRWWLVQKELSDSQFCSAKLCPQLLHVSFVGGTVTNHHITLDRYKDQVAHLLGMKWR